MAHICLQVDNYEERKTLLATFAMLGYKAWQTTGRRTDRILNSTTYFVNLEIPDDCVKGEEDGNT